MSNKMWEALLDHAKTCVLSGKLYVYYTDDSRNVGVVFNNIFELNGLISGEQYLPVDSLSDTQKVGKIYAVFQFLIRCNISCKIYAVFQFLMRCNCLLYCFTFQRFPRWMC